MHRYIAFVWNARIAERNSLANTLGRRLNSKLPGWRCALNTEGIQVYQVGATARASQAYQLDRKGGVVLGKVFARDMVDDIGPGEVSFTERETEKLRQSKGRRLVEHYWGRYVAILKEDRGPLVWILRDPTGAVPCFISDYRGINIICSHVEDCATLGLITTTINWDHVAAYLWFDHLVTKDTGLEGVRQVQAGECIAIGPDNTEATYYWQPDRVFGKRTVENREHAMRELRDVIRSCVGAWASCYNSILHQLSGGLDSAVVLACLPHISDSLSIVCENHFTRNAEGDERDLARKAAKSAGVELIETPIQSSDRSIESMFESTKVATPTLTAFVPETQSRREEIVNTRGIEAVFSGQGGDHFFQSIKTPRIAAEFAWRHGLGGGIFRVISDTSRFTRKPIWSIIGAVISSGLLRKHEDPYDVITPPPLVSDATRDAMEPSCIRHPWVDTAVDLPGSKRRQIFDIVDTQNFYRLPNHYADIVHPFISQPIIELCLQIPSYVLTYGGIDRALVRQAFTGIAPTEIITRTTKGATTAYFNRLLVRNLPYLRGFLLDGRLVTEGLLDKRKTEAALCQSSLIRESELLFPILDAVRAEFWLRTWVSAERQAAA